MKVTSSQSVGEVKLAFSDAYPQLKLAFFTKPHDVNELSGKRDEVSDDILISALSKSVGSTDILIQPDMTVAELEQTFENQMHLHVQVLRKSGGLWLQTSRTDSFTLADQVRMAKESER